MASPLLRAPPTGRPGTQPPRLNSVINANLSATPLPSRAPPSHLIPLSLVTTRPCCTLSVSLYLSSPGGRSDTPQDAQPRATRAPYSTGAACTSGKIVRLWSNPQVNIYLKHNSDGNVCSNEIFNSNICSFDKNILVLKKMLPIYRQNSSLFFFFFNDRTTSEGHEIGYTSRGISEASLSVSPRGGRTNPIQRAGSASVSRVLMAML